MSAFDVDVIVTALCNDEIAAVATYVRSLTARDQARFIERLASLVALVAERQAEGPKTCPVGGVCTNPDLCSTIERCMAQPSRGRK